MSRTARRLLAFYIATIMVLLGTPGVATIVRALRKQKITHEIPIPPFRAQAWLDGSYQKSCETWFAENFPMRNFYVRTSNQINFSVFHEITFKNRTRIIMGRNNSLFRTVYIDSYYGRGAMSPEVIEKFATDLRKLQDRLQSRGITFLFFITPSKPSIYPEDIPEYMKSPSGEPRPSNYDLLVPQLAKHGVETLDGRALFRSMKETSPYPLFPRSGFHWNYYSSVRAVQELTSRLEVIMGKRLNHLHFDRVRTQREPIGSDGDAAQLAYLWSPSVF
ncbi:MAG TPA: hypothetical protein VKU80_00475, partial [Planctomycetota bacterium]|nr:hypothetical protein [Planctomycetota bacterium]